jgi:hypothetical protein
MNSKDEKVKEMIKETGAAFAQSFTDLSKSGYGIPLDGEMVTTRELSDKIFLASESLVRAEKFLRETMPNEFATLDGIVTNINIFNKVSLALRLEYRAKLVAYIDQVLRNLTKDDFTREIMINAANGDAESLKKVREFIGKDIATTNEMLDSKLIRLIKQLI